MISPSWSLKSKTVLSVLLSPFISPAWNAFTSVFSLEVAESFLHPTLSIYSRDEGNSVCYFPTLSHRVGG